MGRGVKTTELLKECLADALIRLMQEKPFDKISVNEIAAAAEVHRSTWFRNYSSKQEALIFKLVQMWNRWSIEHDICKQDGVSPEIIKAIFQFGYEIRSTLRAIYSADVQSVVYDAFYQIMGAYRQSGTGDIYSTRFYAYGLLGLMDEWICQGCRQSPTEMMKIFSRIISRWDNAQSALPQAKNVSKCDSPPPSTPYPPEEVLP